MLLFTVMPPEVVWSPADGGGEPVETLSDGHRHLIVSRLADGRRRLIRLISTEPRDYLDARWQPDTIVPGSPPPTRSGR